MTAYNAVVKYPVGATAGERVTALRMGVAWIAVELVQELEQDPEELREWFDRAIDDAVDE